MERNDFWHNVPKDCEKAISELKRMKVYRLLALDWEDTFADVWWLTLHEVDMYEEGEFCKEASRCAWADPSAMDIRQAEAAFPMMTDVVVTYDYDEEMHKLLGTMSNTR